MRFIVCSFSLRNCEEKIIVIEPVSVMSYLDRILVDER
jgi:hypothetical protein